MTIGPITTSTFGATTAATTQPAQKPDYDSRVWRQHFTDAFDAIAAKLGMSKSDLITALKSGETMKQIEAAKGVSKDDVIAAAAQALRRDDPSLSAASAQQLATSYYDGKVGHRHHHHHHHTPTTSTSTPGTTPTQTQPQTQPVTADGTTIDLMS